MANVTVDNVNTEIVSGSGGSSAASRASREPEQQKQELREIVRQLVAEELERLKRREANRR